MSNHQASRLRRILKWSVLAVPFVATVALSVYLLVPQQPRIILALGQSGGHYLLEPLRQHETGFISLMLGEAGVKNWDGRWLYIEGCCGACGRPWANKGAFVLARLPGGLAYTTKESSRHNHLTRPTLISSKKLLAGSYVFSIVLMVSPFVYSHVRRQWMIRSGRCQTCGYNLTGNVSGICPECGESCEPDASAT